MFLDPEKSYLSGDSEFLARVSDDLRLPSEKEDKASLWAVWSTYQKTARQYLVEKVNYLKQYYPGETSYSIEKIN